MGWGLWGGGCGVGAVGCENRGLGVVGCENRGVVVVGWG